MAAEVQQKERTVLDFLEAQQDIGARTPNMPVSAGSPPTSVYTLDRLLPPLIPIAFDNASDASDKSRGAQTRCSGAWKPLTNRFGANRNGANILDLWSGSLWRMSRFSELKVTGTVTTRFSNSPITRIKVSASGGVPLTADLLRGSGGMGSFIAPIATDEASPVNCRGARCPLSLCSQASA